MKKYYEVGCAIIRKNGKILIAQRKADSFLAHHWEFPGGKIEKGETLEDCLVREVREELGIEIRPVQLLQKKEYIYPEKTVLLDFYLCDWVSGEPQKLDCQDFAWVQTDDFKEFQFPKGDEEILKELCQKKKEYGIL